jgi:glycosyltransferase involved in cell wall biosynthesis
MCKNRKLADQVTGVIPEINILVSPLIFRVLCLIKTDAKAMNSMGNNGMPPIVSIFMVTYNHEKYIAKSIEGIVSQKTSFKFKLFIGEDCSKDNTKTICLNYAGKYPDIVEVISTEKNSIKQNIDNVWKAIFASGAKYIAICEGDDYWTDPDKLQKQTDFLEANPDFSLCFTDVDVIDEMGWNHPDEHYWPSLNKDVLTIDDFILMGKSVIPTATLFFRNIFSYPLPDLYRNAISGDIALHLLLADKGKAKYFPLKTAAYRNHSTGITKSKEVIERANEALFRLFNEFNHYTNLRHDAAIRKRFLAQAKWELIFGAKDKKGIEKIKHYFKRMPDYIKYSGKLDLRELAYYHAILFFPWILKLFKKGNAAA